MFLSLPRYTGWTSFDWVLVLASVARPSAAVPPKPRHPESRTNTPDRGERGLFVSTRCQNGKFWGSQRGQQRGKLWPTTGIEGSSSFAWHTRDFSFHDDPVAASIQTIYHIIGPKSPTLLEMIKGMVLLCSPVGPPGLGLWGAHCVVAVDAMLIFPS